MNTRQVRKQHQHCHGVVGYEEIQSWYMGKSINDEMIIRINPFYVVKKDNSTYMHNQKKGEI